MNIIILAAGMGKRMQSAMPKVLHPIAQQSMLHHVVDTVSNLNPQRIIIVIGHGAEQVKQSFAQEKYQNTQITWAYQEQQLGTGHAVMQALPFVDNNYPSLVLYGDVPLIGLTTLQKLIDTSIDKVGILTAYYDNPTGYGRIVKQNNKVTHIVEEKDATAEQKQITEINTGIMCLPTASLHEWLPSLKNNNAQGEYYLTDVVACAVKDNIEVACSHPLLGNWETFGVNSKKQLYELERLYQQSLANDLLEKGVTIIDANRIDIRGTLTVEKDVTIDVGCVFEGNVHLAQGVHIKPYCVINNSHIGEYSVIESFSHIDNSHIQSNGHIGPYARLRPNTKLADNVKVGNFVELKNANIADNSKVNHLSYVGDSVVGKNVNIGAGVITCNYDGVNKHQTTIEDNAFIGSDCQLVAPVTVGEGATIGAGTTLTKDAPTQQLTLSRAKQLSIASWKRPEKKSKNN
jgi:bifunctional UDP-N-acetylglucosamine pyrophosphorylase/glucosamine-1-phosphate N-acetyltransferase